jgi:hypothetical protein
LLSGYLYSQTLLAFIRPKRENMTKNVFPFAIVLSVLLSYSIFAFAQDETDALRYSYLSPQGTARSMGFGGALGSIGGDFSSLSVNPAGIGLYRSSEITFTPSLKMNNASGAYMGQTTEDNNTRFNINNLGLVATNASKGKRYERSKWKAFSIGIGINRMADLNRDYAYQGYNNTSSGAEVFSIDANNYPNDYDKTSTLAGMGYQTYLVDYDTAGKFYYPLTNFKTGLNQSRTVRERGGVTDVNIALGGNYEEKLMLGATLGIPVVYYNREAVFTETDASNNPHNDFDHFTFTDTKVTRGSGVNLKLGFIHKPNDFFRWGAAIHTPTYFELKDVTTMSLTANTEGFGQTATVDAPDGVFEYTLLTPWRGVVSASGMLGKYGFISADYEYVAYGSARFGYGDGNLLTERYVNTTIKNTYQGASNIRIGAEARFDNFMVRLGFGYYGTPYKGAAPMSNRIDFSGGLGYREDSWFVDLGFVNSQYEHTEHPYILEYAAPLGLIAPTAGVKNSLNNMAVTVGFKF